MIQRHARPIQWGILTASIPLFCALATPAFAQSSQATTREYDTLLADALARKDAASALARVRLLPRLEEHVPFAHQRAALEAAIPKVTFPLVRVQLELQLEHAKRELGDWSGGADGMAGAAGKHGCLTDFTMVGPFANDSNEGFFSTLPPETGESGPYQGKVKDVSWRPLPDYNNFCVLNVDSAVFPKEQAVVFLANQIEVKKKREANLLVGASGSYKIWLDGVLVGEREENTGLLIDNDAWKITLEPGQNNLLVKLASGQSESPDIVLRLVDKDFEPIADAKVSATWGGTPTEARPKVAPSFGERGSLAQAKRLATSGTTAEAVWGAWLWSRVDLRNAATPWRDVADKIDKAIDEGTLSLQPKEHILLAELFEEHWKRVEVFERANKLHPNDPWLIYNLAEEYSNGMNERRQLERRALFEKLVEKHPDFAPGIIGLSGWWRDKGFPYRALAVIKDSATPERLAIPAYRRFYIMRLDAAGMEREARAQRDILGTEVQSDVVWRQIHEAITTGDKERALALIRVQKERTSWSSHWPLKEADLLRAVGNLDEALAVLEARLVGTPGDGAVLRKKVELLLAKGDAEAAIETLEIARVYKPQDQELNEHLAHLRPDVDRFHDVWMVDDLRELSKSTNAGPFHTSTLVDQSIVRVAPNGLSQEVRQVVERVNTSEGIDSARTTRVSYTVGDESVDILRVRVLKADGTISEDYDMWRSDGSRKGSTTYNDNGSVTLRANNVEPGDIVEFRYQVSQVANRNFRGDYFGDIEYVQSTEPIAFARYTVLYPEKWGELFFRPPSVAHSRVDDVTPTKVPLQAGYKSTSFEMRDVPYVKTDPDQPGYTDVYDYILVSNKKTYNEVGQWWWNLVKEQLIVDENISATVKKLTKGLKTEDEKVRAIHNYVVQNTRYLHVGLGIHGWKPYRTTTCFRNRYGDCKDKAALLKVMLEEAGVKTNLVLVRTRRLGSVEDFPASMHIFNHAIAYVPSLDLYLDGTAEYNGTRELTSMDQGAQALVVEDGGTTRWVTLPVDESSVNLMEREMTVDLTSGEPVTTLKITARGANAVYYRSTLEDPERRDEVLEKQLASDFPGAKLVKATYSDMTKLERPVEITVTFKGGRLLRESDKRRYLYPLGERKDLLGAYADQAKRNQDLSIRVPFTSKTTMRYRLPVDSKAGKLPAAKNLKSKFGSLDIEYRREKDAVIAEVRYSIDVQRVSASEYPEFRKFMSEATSALNETIDLE